MEEFISILYPLFTIIFPESSTQGTLKIIVLSGSTIPETLADGLSIPGFTSANKRRTALFDDSFLSRQYHILANMTSSLLFVTESDGTITDFPRNAASDTGMTNYLRKSATAGFVYNNAEEGTDSIAFGGLKK